MAGAHARGTHCRNLSPSLQIPALELETSSVLGAIGNLAVKDVQGE
jgi:hypothetical protein